MTTRRQFLAGCSVLTFAAGVAPSVLLAAPARGVSLNQVNYDFFAAQLGGTFHVSQKAAPDVTLKLVEAKLMPAHSGNQTSPDAGHEKFSLLFRGPASVALDQDTHTFEHAGLGQFAMFIVPVRMGDTQHAYYGAMFNRPAPRNTI